MSFVFSHFLASFPLFRIFCVALLPPHRRDGSALPGTSKRPSVRLRQCVHNQATIVGYHKCKGLSSAKCKKAERSFPNSFGMPAQTSPAVVAETKPDLPTSRRPRVLSAGWGLIRERKCSGIIAQPMRKGPFSFRGCLRASSNPEKRCT